MRTVVKANFIVQALFASLTLLLCIGLIFSRMTVLFLLYEMLILAFVQPISAMLMYFTKAPNRKALRIYLLGILLYIVIGFILGYGFKFGTGEPVMDGYLLFGPLPITAYYWYYSYRARQAIRA